MLVQFSVRNYKTFKDKVTLSMIATADNTREEDNVINVPKFNLRLLKSAVVYGANASGKSKLLSAMNFMRNFVVNSSKEGQIGAEIDVDSFRLNAASEKESSEFEIIFIQNGGMFRYGFEATQEKIVAEWLYHKPKTKEVEIFYRNAQEFTLHKTQFPKGHMVVKEGLVRNNALLLSVAAQFNDEIASMAITWIGGLVYNSQTENALMNSRTLTLSMAKNEKFKTIIIGLLQEADIGIQDFFVMDSEKFNVPIEKLSEIDLYSFLGKTITTTHNKYDDNGNIVGFEYFDLDKDESSGTSKYFALLGSIVLWLNHWGVLVIDELDAKLHPNLVCRIIALFNSKETNPNNAQLIFNTHDTNLLGTKLFRRDQIWFTEKNRYEAAHLYSLADIKVNDTKVRKEENWEENYIRGKYGAVPYLGDFAKLFNQ